MFDRKGRLIMINIGSLQVRDEWYRGWLDRALRRADFPDLLGTSPQYKTGWDAACQIPEEVMALCLLLELRAGVNIYLGRPPEDG